MLEQNYGPTWHIPQPKGIKVLFCNTPVIPVVELLAACGLIYAFYCHAYRFKRPDSTKKQTAAALRV